MEITSSLINDPSMSVVKKSLLEASANDNELDFRVDTIEYINDASDEDDDEFFYDCVPTILFINSVATPEYKDSIAFTTPDKAIYLNCPGDKIGKSVRKWEFIYDHECLHQLWDTFGVADELKAKGIKYDHTLLNLASDCVINDYLKNIRKKEWIGIGIDPEYIKKNFDVDYDRKNDTQFGLYVKMLEKLDQIKDDPIYKDETQFDKKIQVPINQGDGQGGTPPPIPTEKHSDEYKRGWREGIQDVLDNKVDPKNYTPKSGSDDYTQGYNDVIENIKKGLEDGITLSDSGGSQGNAPETDLADIPWDIPQQGGSSSSSSQSSDNSDINDMNENEAAEDAQQSADNAKQAADAVQNKADQTGDKGDKQAANDAAKAAKEAQDAADDAKEAAENGDAEGARNAAKEAREKANEAQDAAGTSDSYSGKAQQAAQRADRAAKAAQRAADNAKGNKDYSDKKTSAEKAKDAAKEAQQAAAAAAKAEAKGDTKGAKKAANDAENAAQEAEKEARDAGANVAVNKDNGQETDSSSNSSSSSNPGKGSKEITSITKADLDEIKRIANEAIEKAKNKISGDFGKLVKKMRASKSLKPALVVNISSGAKGWNEKMKSVILGYVKAQVNKYKRQYQSTWKRIKRGSGFVESGKLMQKGKIQKKNGLPINIGFYIDRSGSMGGSPLKNAFKSAYTISETIKKMFKNEKVISDTIFKFYAFDTSFKQISFGDIPNDGGGTAPFEEIFDYIVDHTNDYMINIIITDGQMDASETEIAKRIKELQGLVVYVANQNCIEIENISKKYPEKVKFILADSSFQIK